MNLAKVFSAKHPCCTRTPPLLSTHGQGVYRSEAHGPVRRHNDLRTSARTAETHPVCGSALSPPCAANQFDFVHCNGVLHHTREPKMGFDELLRVTRLGGTVFISVYGRGGLYNALVTTARAVSPVIPFRWMRGALKAVFGEARGPNSFMPATVSVLDNMYVAIRHRYREADIRRSFEATGCSAIKT